MKLPTVRSLNPFRYSSRCVDPPQLGRNSLRQVDDAGISGEVEGLFSSMRIASPSSACEARDHEHQLSSVLDWMVERRMRAIVVDLPSPAADVNAVRVLVPGASTNVYPSTGAGEETRSCTVDRRSSGLIIHGRVLRPALEGCLSGTAD